MATTSWGGELLEFVSVFLTISLLVLELLQRGIDKARRGTPQPTRQIELDRKEQRVDRVRLLVLLVALVLIIVGYILKMSAEA